MAAADSPTNHNNHINLKKANKRDFQFDLKEEESFEAIEFQNDKEKENKMYDQIIAKVLNNPRIDKRTLLKKFIAKIEMESNVQNGGHLASELSQIKQMMNESNEWIQ